MTHQEEIPATNPNRWGLLPELAAGEPHTPRALMRHFFVEFNPLYFVSAFCMLSGVFLVARNLDGLGLKSIEAQQFALFGVIQLYEVLVIAGAAFLAHRAHATRPAVLLALLECVLLLDCTFRIESAAVQGAFGHLLIVVWLLLTAAKVWGLARALRLTVTRKHLAGLMTAATGMVGCILWLTAPGADQAVAVQASLWFGALVVLLLERLPALTSALARSEVAKQRAALCIRAGLRVLTGFYFYHLAAYIALSAQPHAGFAAVPACVGALFLYFALIREGQTDTWRYGILTIVAAAFQMTPLAWALGLIGTLWLVRVWRGAHGNLAVGAAFAIYAAAWLAGWTPGHGIPDLPQPQDWRSLALAAGLVLIAWRMKNLAAKGILALGLGYLIYSRVNLRAVVPADELGRGMLLLGIGFAALFGGVLVNWLFRNGEQGNRANGEAAV